MLSRKTPIKFSHEELLALYKATRYMLDAEPHTPYEGALHSAKDTLTDMLNLADREEPFVECPHVFFYGPGHQSQTKCRLGQGHEGSHLSGCHKWESE